MKLSADELRAVAAEWRAARRIYSIYQGIAQQAELDIAPCPELESPIDRAESEALEAVRAWFCLAETAILVPHLRVYCQTSPAVGEAVLRGLLLRHLSKPEKNESDRDKVDFLLVQYFATCAPDSMLRDDLNVQEVASVLAPVIGETQVEIPNWLNPLEGVLQRLRECCSIKELLRKGLLYQERKIKQATDEMYFTPAVMASFARFNFLVRRVFFRLMHSEVSAIRSALAQLESRGVGLLDMSRAGVVEPQAPAAVRASVARWREPMRDEYAYGRSVEAYTAIRDVVEAAVAALPPIAAAAAAGVSAPSAASAPLPIQPAVVVADEPAETQSETEFFAVPEDSNTSVPTRDIAAEFAAVQAELEVQLKSAQTEEKVMTRVVLGGQRVLLSSWEVRAFVNSTEQFAEAMRRGVAARVLLGKEIETVLAGAPAELACVFELAHAEDAVLHEQVARAREARDIDAAVTLTATSKRLTQLMEEAEKLKQEGNACKTETL